MSEILKLVLPAASYPNDSIKAKPIEYGDTFIVPHTETRFKIGERYRGFNNLVISKVYYKPKKWWQFWKRREPLCYQIRCVR